MLNVIKVIDCDYNNTGQWAEYYMKARTEQIIDEDELAVLEFEGVSLNIVRTMYLHFD